MRTKSKIIILVLCVFCLTVLFGVVNKVLAADSALPAKYQKSDYSASLTILNKENLGEVVKYTVEIQNTGLNTWIPVTEQEFSDLSKRSSLNYISVGWRILEDSAKRKVVFEDRWHLSKPIAKGEKFQVILRINKNKLQPGEKYIVKFDMVNELKFWFSDLGGGASNRLSKYVSRPGHFS